MGSYARLPVSALPLWQSLNDVAFADVRVADFPGKGAGLAAERPLSTADAAAQAAARPLLSVPRSLVLHAEAVEQYAKQDRNFRQLLDAAGHQSERGDVLLYLLVQIVLGLKPAGANCVALSTPWTEYVKFLPDNVPLPTMWTDSERLLLQGTSLEAAVGAKLLALEHEFDQLRETSSDLPFWQAAFWDDSETGPQLRHWVLADAWYRSRCLALPQSGPAMVPCLDLVNHGAAANAYYEETRPAGDDGAVVLLLRPQQALAAGEEITISYSGDGTDDARKPPSEMLFSYGFVDPHAVRHRVVLPFRPFADDPLAKAKLHVFGRPGPRLEVEATFDGDDGDALTTRWSCPFAYLMCVNEEDGLSFRLRQSTDGGNEICMFWDQIGGNPDEVDITERAPDFAAVAETHVHSWLFRLRALTVVQEALESQLERMQAAVTEADSDGVDIRADVAAQAGLLRNLESRVLSAVLETLARERAVLLTDSRVVGYLGSMEVTENDLAVEEASNHSEADQTMTDPDAEDFS